jgi:hypothetical protein
MSEAATAEKLDESPAEEAPDAQTEETPEAVREVPDELKVSPPGVNRFGLAAEHIQPWLMNVPHKTLPEQCLEQEFWQHISMHLSAGDTIIVRPDDMAWKLELHVINAGHNWAQVAREQFFQFATREEMPKIESIYSVRFAGTTHKWQVLRKGELLKEGIETEALARRAAANHELAARR